MATTNDIKNGTVLKLEGQLWNIIEFQHVKPGKGGAFVRTKMRNVMSGKVVDKTFNAGLKIETATVDRRDYQYLYQDGADFVFMDTSDFDQLTVPAATVGDATNFMLENQMVNIAIHEGNPLYIELPAVRRPRDHLHRAGPAGRPLLGRHQARHRSKPATKSRFRCSSRTTPRSRSTPATAATSAVSTTDMSAAAARPATAPWTFSLRPSSAPSPPLDG